jgi:hypothetical protein
MVYIVTKSKVAYVSSKHRVHILEELINSRFMKHSCGGLFYERNLSFFC